MDWQPYQGGYRYYIDTESIQEGGGHKLVWVKTILRKCVEPESEAKKKGILPRRYTCEYVEEPFEPFELDQRELDCAGQYLDLRSYGVHPGSSEFIQKQSYAKKEWQVILPDTHFRAVEKAACGK